MPYYLARDYAADLGFDEATFRTFREQRAEVQKFQDQYDRSAERFGLDNEKAKVSGQQFMQTLRGLQQTATVLSEKFYSDLAPSLTRVAERFQNWIDTHPDQINAALEVGEKVVLSFAHAVEWLGGKIGPVIVQIGDWAKAITGKDGLQDTLDNFATWVLGFWAAKIVAGFLKVGGGWAAMLLRLGIPAGIASAASGGGHETPEQYQESLKNDPARAQADAELNKNGGAAKRWWKRNMPTWLGGDPASTTSSETTEPGRFSALKSLIQGVESGSHKYNSVYGNGKYGWPDKPVTEMTVSEALAYQRTQKAKYGTQAFPVGRGQFVERTLRRLAQEHNAFDQVMNPRTTRKVYGYANSEARARCW